MGIEPISSVWKTEVIATIPYPHFKFGANQQTVGLGKPEPSGSVPIEGGTQNRTGDKGFAILCLTTWPCHHSPINARDATRGLTRRPREHALRVWRLELSAMKGSGHDPFQNLDRSWQTVLIDNNPIRAVPGLRSCMLGSGQERFRPDWRSQSQVNDHTSLFLP